MYCILPPDLTSSSPRILSYLYLKKQQKEGPRWGSARFVDSEHIPAAASTSQDPIPFEWHGPGYGVACVALVANHSESSSE